MSQRGGSPDPGSTADRILDAAERLFADRGYAGTSVRDIAAQVGLNQASLYNHFPSKQALYEAVLERGLRPIADLLAGAPAQGLDAASGDLLTEQLAAHLWENPWLPKLLQREVLDGRGDLDPAVLAGLRAIYQRGREAMDLRHVGPPWSDSDLPLLVIAFYHLLFGHFTAAALLHRVIGLDPFSPEMRRTHVEFLKKASRALLGGPT